MTLESVLPSTSRSSTEEFNPVAVLSTASLSNARNTASYQSTKRWCIILELIRLHICTENTDQAPKLVKPWIIWSDRREGGSADSVDAESAKSSPLVIESVNYPTSKKVSVASTFTYLAAYDARRLSHMMVIRYATLDGFLRAAKGLSHPRLPPSLLLSRPSPCRSK